MRKSTHALPRSSVLFLVLVGLSLLTCTDKEVRWIDLPAGEQPPVALINQVWFDDGHRYVHPSFDYAASGFLLDIGTDTLAVTAKHVLWIAQHPEMQSVALRPWLQRWVMHPKGNPGDSVVIQHLINRDTNEILNGPGSSIIERDWLIFTTSYVSPEIQPLQPAYRMAHPGEKLTCFACPYTETNCISFDVDVIRTEGSRIIVTRPDGLDPGGVSGCPMVDSLGLVVGIFTGTAINPENGESALFGTSTHYLKRALSGRTRINEPLTSVATYLRDQIATNNIDQALSNTRALMADSENWFKYNFLPEHLNVVVTELLDADDFTSAEKAVKLSIETQAYFSQSHALHAKALLGQMRIEEARVAANQSLTLWSENPDALEVLNQTN